MPKMVGVEARSWDEARRKVEALGHCVTDVKDRADGKYDVSYRAKEEDGCDGMDKWTHRKRKIIHQPY